MGRCQYTLAQDNCENGLKTDVAPNFLIKQKNWKEYKGNTKNVAFTKEITVLIYGHVRVLIIFIT